MVMFTPLQAGDQVALVAPAGHAPTELLESAAAILQAAGFTPYIHPQCHLRDGRFAGNDKQRLDALHDVYADQSVGAIWCVRGGYGAVRLLDNLDYDLIKANPKPLVGLSDITALLLAIHQFTGQVTFHGRMAADTARKPCAVTDGLLWNLLRGQWGAPNEVPEYAPVTLQAGEARGKLLGGNLATLVSMIGSREAPNLQDSILFLEDINEPYYRIDRLFLQLARAKLGTPRAVVIGAMTDMVDDAKGTAGWNIPGIVQSHFGHLSVPIVLNYPAGHIQHQTILPIGAEVVLKAKENDIELVPAQALFA